jgi:hypothetical protein
VLLRKVIFPSQAEEQRRDGFINPPGTELSEVTVPLAYPPGLDVQVHRAFGAEFRIHRLLSVFDGAKPPTVR